MGWGRAASQDTPPCSPGKWVWQGQLGSGKERRWFLRYSASWDCGMSHWHQPTSLSVSASLWRILSGGSAGVAGRGVPFAPREEGEHRHGSARGRRARASSKEGKGWRPRKEEEVQVRCQKGASPDSQWRALPHVSHLSLPPPVFLPSFFPRQVSWRIPGPGASLQPAFVLSAPPPACPGPPGCSGDPEASVGGGQWDRTEPREAAVQGAWVCSVGGRLWGWQGLRKA